MIIVTNDSNLIGKRIKNPKEFAINGNIILKGHGTNHDDFSILLNESSVFKLHLKESLLIKKDQPELNGNNYSYPLELFDWSFYFCFIAFFQLLTILKINKIFYDSIFL